VLGKYLVAVSTGTDSGKGNGNASTKRTRLHILYLLNDLLHHTKYHGNNTSSLSILSGAIQPFLVDLFERAGSFDSEKHLKHHTRVDDLLDIWTRNTYFSWTFIDKLRETVNNAAKLQPDGSDQARKDTPAGSGKASASKDAPFVMPSTHGDPSTPYYDLPAGNMMPHIIPNSSTPIKPELVRPLQFLAGPADPALANAVKNLLKDVEQIYGSTNDLDEGMVPDIDEMGETMVRDEITGEIMEGTAYYGWSRAFCERMKRRRNSVEGNPTRRRRYSSSQSSSRSRSPRKRRRHSESVSRSRSRSHQRRQSRSRSQSRPRSYGRSHSRPRQHTPPSYRNGDGRSRSPSRSRSLTRTPSRVRQFRNRSRSHSYSPPPPPPAFAPPHQMHHFPAPFTPSSQQAFPPPPPPPIPGTTNFPAPPPRPPNYTGPWPPPPPPNMPPNLNMSNMPFPFPPQQGQGQGQFHHPYPPPPPSGPLQHSAFPQSHSPPGQGRGQWGGSPPGPGPNNGYGYGYGGTTRSGYGGGRGRGGGGGWQR
jgi:hypothetical protein